MNGANMRQTIQFRRKIDSARWLQLPIFHVSIFSLVPRPVESVETHLIQSLDSI